MRILVSNFNLMSSLLSAGRRLFALGSATILPSLGLAQSLSPQAGEFSFTAGLAGDQVQPRIGVNRAGGYVVWQDNRSDGDGLGISARRLNENLSGVFTRFRVNESAAGDQEYPQVAVFEDGGAVFVWQGGAPGSQRISARFIGADRTFRTGDIAVSAYAGGEQVDPAVAALRGGSVVVVWSSFKQDGSWYGVYGQLFDSAGQKIGAEFRVNQTVALSQRSPSVASLTDGRAVVAWISESSLGIDTNGVERFSANVYGRLFDSQGVAVGNEFMMNGGSTICANPNVVASPAGGFTAAWSQKDLISPRSNSWDIIVRSFDSPGIPAGPERRINSHLFGDQFLPRLGALESGCLVVWTSLAQDGSREGVFGRFVSETGEPAGDEFRVNTRTASSQIHPAVASDGVQRAVVVWSGFVGGESSFDLLAQRYAASPTLPAMEPPFISALSQSRLSVTWPEMAGFDVKHYEVYLDDGTVPSIATNGMWTATGLVAGSTHSVRLAYVLADGRRSPVSSPTSGTTWAEDANFDGLPDDWQVQYWGADSGQWPSGLIDSDGDGASNAQEFLAGTKPTDANDVLQAQLVSTAGGTWLTWNSKPGLVYQVQTATNLDRASWSSQGGPRFAVGAIDSVLVSQGYDRGYYRIIRLR